MTGKNVFATLVVLLTSLTLAGCGVGREPAAEGGAAAAVDVPLRDPGWLPAEGFVVALQDDGRRLVRLDTGASFEGTQDFPTTISEELEGVVGENLGVEEGRSPDNIYLPKPERDQVTVVENDSLLEVRNFNAGESPVRIALGGTSTGSGSQTLFALSGDGQTVTSVGLENFDVISEVEVGASEGALMEASGEDGFWLADADGVALYEGDPPELAGELPLGVGALTVDANDPQRAYVGESSRVVAVEPDGEGGIRTAAGVDLGTAAEYLAARDGQLYAVTGEGLVVLDSETLEEIETIEFGPLLERENLEQAEPSGMAVGNEDVYVTLEGEPYVLLTERP